jgi:hypothetical protein
VDVAGLGTFVKYASEILMGYPPKRLLALVSKSSGLSANDIPVKLCASKAVCDELRALVKESYANFSTHLVSVHKEMRSKEVSR